MFLFSPSLNFKFQSNKFCICDREGMGEKMNFSCVNEKYILCKQKKIP